MYEKPNISLQPQETIYDEREPKVIVDRLKTIGADLFPGQHTFS